VIADKPIRGANSVAGVSAAGVDIACTLRDPDFLLEFSMIKLKQATLDETVVFKELYVSSFARDAVSYGLYVNEEDGIEHGRKDIADPASARNAERNVWLAISVEGVDEPVGLIWLAIEPKVGAKSYILELFVIPAYRRQGYAKAAMLALEDYARSLGIGHIALGVYLKNVNARALYDSLGYKVDATDDIDVTMGKSIVHQAPQNTA
jgi:GNAT superfamily N-acetyltransferase